MATHPQLSTGFIQQIHDASDANDQLPPPPTLQILSIKRANTASKPAATERYRYAAVLTLDFIISMLAIYIFT